MSFVFRGVNLWIDINKVGLGWVGKDTILSFQLGLLKTQLAFVEEMNTKIGRLNSRINSGLFVFILRDATNGSLGNPSYMIDITDLRGVVGRSQAVVLRFIDNAMREKEKFIRSLVVVEGK